MSSVELRSMAGDESGPTFKQWARKQIQPCEIIKWAIAIFLVVLFFCCYIVVFSVFKTEDQGNRTTTRFDDGFFDTSLPRINCTLFLDKLDYGVGVSLLFDCTNGLPAELVDTRTGLYLKKQLNIIINRRSYSFPENTIPSIISVPVSWESGTLQDYPFDKYDAQFEVFMYTGPSPPVLGSEVELSILASKIIINSVAVEYKNAVANANLDAIPGYVLFSIHSDRTSIGLVYPVFLIIAFWLLTVAVGGLGIWHFVLRKKIIEPPLLAMFAAVLFSVPILRNTAPQSPQFGCEMDYAAFFWTMLTCVLSFTLASFRFMEQGIDKRPFRPRFMRKTA